MADQAPASAPAAPAQAASDNASAAPAANPVSQAAKTLASAREARRAALKATSTTTAGTSSAASSPAESAQESTKKTPEQSPKPGETDNDDEVAQLIREDRRVKAEAKKVEARAAEVDTAAKRLGGWMPKIEAAEAAFAKGDVINGVRALLPNPDMANSLFWELAKTIGEDGGETPPVDFDKLFEEKYEARRQAEQEEEAERTKTAAAAATAELNTARGEFLEACNTVFQGGHSKYPEIVRLFRKLGPDATPAINRRIVEKVENHYRATKEMMSAARALEEVEKDLLSADPPAAETPSKPSPTVTSSWRSDPGRPAPAETGRRSLDQIREERRARLRGS